MRRTIDTLTPGEAVRLGFVEYGSEPAIFIGIEGEGEERLATFESKDADNGHTYRWQAYRYCGHWAYGTSADHLRLVAE